MRNFLINFLPYAPVKEDIKIGKVLLWPFYKKKDEYIPDDTIKTHLEIIFKQYICTETLKSLNEITIISLDDKIDFKELNPNEMEEVRSATSILSFCSIVNRDFSNPVSSDNFQIFLQRFKPGDDKIAPSHGSWIRHNVINLKIQDAKFITPFHICIPPFGIDYNEKILRGLEKVLMNRSKQEEARTLRALEWFNYANINIDGFNYFTRIILMSIAFEILLGGYQGKFEFMEKVKGLMCETNEYTVEREIPDKDGKQVKECHTDKEWFAYDFYNLRNKIVHGNKLEETNEKHSSGEFYFELAISFFKECMKKTLSTLSYYKYDAMDSILWVLTAEKISQKKRAAK
ncbi:hypothetical protein COY52_00540 [Candidatus Desantisbacteria bacterium CG_4_10_14_0_8_um_filter_48_22]|uniref:Uncharacterized protein n=1 Tax=Candidatus Desantisbacteria bacterium CG_4_10_14_0_8_um_filter_48_22 TaxID=1974543 RepID=A0A2M7SFD8_9BACT|nr:MAG: hypothetical protein AUJ67_03945 [Candidatus Desantisbacteria bacterium CG1_02_49_89]PIV57288.1 MAG: hypothetical protein COS16_01125 [Candidatus Desantisbacteria bacterium CG02_land_8_20_14_3_00_49_13]PIZ18209.1 MAG: hypothetical protein COY52_00540 [Candidatus Desantisbacteria bacterium CG_4_10_14_0_8_um_filter_48_22]PJB27766.1 MAG: hypothetical protein CO111_03550 [Candidatus Desantisbacteria bacterium CG_4_9_14_3_um_filter_50_7]